MHWHHDGAPGWPQAPGTEGGCCTARSSTDCRFWRKGPVCRSRGCSQSCASCWASGCSTDRERRGWGGRAPVLGPPVEHTACSREQDRVPEGKVRRSMLATCTTAWVAGCPQAPCRGAGKGSLAGYRSCRPGSPSTQLPAHLQDAPQVACGCLQQELQCQLVAAAQQLPTGATRQRQVIHNVSKAQAHRALQRCEANDLHACRQGRQLAPRHPWAQAWSASPHTFECSHSTQLSAPASHTYWERSAVLWPAASLAV